jgi:hypothetical protein
MPKFPLERSPLTFMHPLENKSKSGLLSVPNSNCAIDCDGCGTVSVDLRGANVNLTLIVEGSYDNFVQSIQTIPMLPINQAVVQYAATFGGTVPGSWMGDCAGYTQVRARATAVTQPGDVIVTASIAQFVEPPIAPLFVTSTAASGAALTVTASAPGVGLRIYTVDIIGEKFAAAALTAGAAPILATTTGLPGAPPIRFPAAVMGQGELAVKELGNAQPVPAIAQNTAVTLVLPATTGVIWSGGIRYKVGK